MGKINPEDLETILQRFTRDFSFYSVAKLVPALLGLVALAVFTRLFPPASFGRYALAAATVSVGSTLFFDWIGKAVFRFAPELDEEEVVGNAVSFLGLGSVLFLALASGGYVLFSDRLGAYQPFYVAVTALILLQGYFNVFYQLYQTTLQSKSAMVFRVGESVLKLVFAVVLAVFVLDHIVGWIWGAFVAMVLTVGMMSYQLGWRRLYPRLQKDVISRLARYGLPLLGWILGTPLLREADRVLIEYLADSAAVGVYSSNYAIADRGVHVLFLPMLTAAYPIIMNAWNGSNEREVQELITGFTRYFFILAVPAFVLIAALSRPMSTILLDARYHEGYVVFPLVAAGIFFWSIANIGQKGLEIREQTALISVGVMGAVVANVLLNFPLILLYGYVGAAVATLLSFAAYAVFVHVVSRRSIQWQLPIRTIRNTLLAGLVMAGPPIFVYFIGSYTISRVFIATTVGGVTYLLVLYPLDELNQSELSALKALLT